MATIKIETTIDPVSGQFFAEVFTDDSSAPVLRSEPAFSSESELVEQILKMCREHFPDHAPVADDPTIGV